MRITRYFTLFIALWVPSFAGAAAASAASHPPLPLNAAELRAAKARSAERYRAHRPSARALPSSSPRGATVTGGLNKPGLGNPPTNDRAPSDSTGAVGPNHYVEMVNAKIGVFDRHTLSLVNSQSFEDFIKHPEDNGFDDNSGPFDPQMIWDPATSRWFYLMDDIGPETVPGQKNGSDYLAFGWSKTSDPTDLTNGWCHFRINTDSKFGGLQGQYLADYPKLGDNNTQLAFGANLFNNLVAPSMGSDETGGFASASILTVPKPANGNTACPAETSFQNSANARGGPGQAFGGVLQTSSSQPAFTPVPVNTFDSSGTGYVMIADSPADGASRNTLSAYTFNGAGAISAAPQRFTVPPYDVPGNAPQPGTGNVIDTLDGRLTQAVGHADPRAGGAEAIWTQHTVNGTGDRAAVRWYELIPAGGQVRQQGTIADSASFAFNAAISPASDGAHAAFDYSLSGPTQLPKILARSRSGSQQLGFLGPATTLGTSAASMTDTTDCGLDTGSDTTICRWGDYAAATPDPNNPLLVWGSNQFVGPLDTDRKAPQWETRNFALDTSDTPPVARFKFSPSRALTKTPVSFDGRSSSDADGHIVSYRWNFGGTQTSTSANPRHTYGRDGHYRVTLTVTDDGGNTATTSHIVTIVDRAPLVSLRVLTAHPRAGHAVRFDGRRSRDPDGRVTGYRWNFGGRQGSRRSAPSHVFGRAGRYRITLKVIDDEHRSATARRTIVVAR